MSDSGLAVQIDDPRLATPVQALLAFIEHQTRHSPVRQLMLVGASPGVGSSFVANMLTTRVGESWMVPVMLVEVDGEACDETPQAEIASRLESASAETGVVRVRLSINTCLRMFGSGKRGGEGVPDQWSERFELIVWDVPPPTVMPVALSMAKAMDGIVLVARANKTRRQVAQYMIGRLEETGGRVLGVILNRTVIHIPDWIYRWL